jgi:hypothetical protein
MIEHPLLQNLEFVTRLVNEWPVPNEKASEEYVVQQAIKEFLRIGWLVVEKFAPGLAH